MNSSSRFPSLPQWLVASLVLILLQFLVDLHFANAAPAKKTKATKTAALPPALLKVEQAYQKATTLEANFTQISHVAMTGAKKESSGVVMVKRPGKFRWETLKPEKNLLVSDGTKYWFYTPPFETGERGQVIEKRSREVQSELADQLLSGSFSTMKNTKIETLNERTYRLTPVPGTAGTVKTAEVEIDPVKSLIEKVKLSHEGGNEVLITLTSLKLGEKMDEAYFSFLAPSGTDVIKE